jgi:hypothetical protein
MGEDVLNGIGELEGIDISETVLNVSVNDELGQTKNFSAQMEGVSETRLLSLLRRQSPGRSRSAIIS